MGIKIHRILRRCQKCKITFRKMHLTKVIKKYVASFNWNIKKVYLPNNLFFTKASLYFWKLILTIIYCMTLKVCTFNDFLYGYPFKYKYITQFHS
jgi:hypothetical protein